MKILFLFFFTISFHGCSISILNLKKDLKEQSQLTTINVKVNIDKKTDSPIIIALINDRNKILSVVDYQILNKSNHLSFSVEPSKYMVFAFEDLDKNRHFSSNERMAKTSIMDIKNINKSVELNIDEFPSKEEINKIENMKKNISINLNNSSAYIGSLTSIDSPYFSNKNVKQGIWEPYSFIKEVPFGIFLLEKYDPNKKVLLFIHGISGSPKNFSYLINNLDKSQYQVFVAYYPSGISMNYISKYLSNAISDLSIRFKFKSISIIAHSMGGLISRNIINLLPNNSTFKIDTFISISSPFGGDRNAINAVKYSPIVMPVWKDISAESNFIKNLYVSSLPKNLKYYLIFGIKGKKDTDGVVSILSQLRMDAQRESLITRGFNEDHDSILKSEKVFKHINELLRHNK